MTSSARDRAGQPRYRSVDTIALRRNLPGGDSHARPDAYERQYSNRQSLPSGGTALNCLSNSRIWREGPFDNVFIEPTCDDGGLAIGAALHIYHNLRAGRSKTTSPSPYLGTPYGESAVEAALETASGIVWSQPDDPAAAAAADLVGDKIIAWFEGGAKPDHGRLDIARSWPMSATRTIGGGAQRARSALRAHRFGGEGGDWFDGCPMPSPYMLFTATVRSTDLPAITHVDGSSRIQTVDASCGGIRHVLEAFDRETGVPVLMNTSFNGPGEPIVETPAHAVAFLQGSGRLYPRSPRRPQLAYFLSPPMVSI